MPTPQLIQSTKLPVEAGPLRQEDTQRREPAESPQELTAPLYAQMDSNLICHLSRFEYEG